MEGKKINSRMKFRLKMKFHLRMKRNFWNTFLITCLLISFLLQLPSVIYAGDLNHLKDKLNRLIQNQSSGINHTVLFTAAGAVSGGDGNNKVIVTFPDTDDATWCSAEGTDLTVAGCTEDSANALSGTPGLTARCVKGVGVSSYDTIYVEQVDDLSAGLAYCVSISDGSTAKLGTPLATTSGVITVKTNNGSSDVDTGQLPVDIITSDQVAVTARVGEEPGGHHPPGGGGTARIIFSGYSYPKSSVFLIKDAEMAGTTVAGNNGSFQISLDGISAGTYVFGLYAKDETGLASRLLVYTLRIEEGVTVSVANILIPATITADRAEVKKGDKITISGWAIPNAYISIFVKDSQKGFTFQTYSDSSGKYQYILNTGSLAFGNVNVFAQSSFDNLIFSESSKTITFLVGTKSVKKPLQTCPVRADLNNDCAVNLIDFSILVYWFDKSLPPGEVDLSGDGVVNMTDFSIMAYYWTG